MLPCSVFAPTTNPPPQSEHTPSVTPIIATVCALFKTTPPQPIQIEPLAHSSQNNPGYTPSLPNRNPASTSPRSNQQTATLLIRVAATLTLSASFAFSAATRSA